MTLRRIQIWAVAVVFSTLLLASGAVQPARRNSVTRNAATTFTFEGCWTQFPAGPCRDVFRDDQGNYWICKACGTTGNPSPGKCSIISPTTLAHGFWCS
jgi:hypothetical protein